MKCAVHPDIDAIGFCRNCGKALCPQCAREVRGALYCEQCLATLAPLGPAAQFVAPGAPPAYRYPVVVEPQGPNPGTACALGFIPGLGAVYNGEYVKGLIHVIIFGGLIAMMSKATTCRMECRHDRHLLRGLLLLYADRSLSHGTREAPRASRNRLLRRNIRSWWSGRTGRHSYTGSIILIVLGVVFLLATTGVLNSIGYGIFGRSYLLPSASP